MMAPADPARTFGRYRVLGLIGRGGFAEVFRAQDPALNREVALKALLPPLAADDELRGRFVTEARVLAGLRHPNIVTVYDVGDASDPAMGGYSRPFFTMELVPGQTLSARLALGRGLPLDEVTPIVRDVALALDALHAAGIVHRDVTVHNVMVDEGGRAMLMDFGVARVSGGRRTRSNEILGTAESLSPEQIRGEPAGPASDIYALGVLAFQLLTGRPPFEGELARLLLAHAYDPPPSLRTLVSGLPAYVEEAVRGALAKQPAERPATAGAFATALGGGVLPAVPAPALVVTALLPGPPGMSDSTTLTAMEDQSPAWTPPPLSHSRRVPRRRWWLAGAAAVMVAGAFGMLATGWLLPSSGSGGPSGALTVVERGTTDAALVSDVTVFDQLEHGEPLAGEFVQASDSVIVCFHAATELAGSSVTLLVTDRGDLPRTRSDPHVVAKVDVTVSTDTQCAATPLAMFRPAPAPYWVWVLRGPAIVASGGFRLLAPSTPAASEPVTAASPTAAPPVVAIRATTAPVAAAPRTAPPVAPVIPTVVVGVPIPVVVTPALLRPTEPAAPTATPTRTAAAPLAPQLGQAPSPALGSDPSVKIFDVAPAGAAYAGEPFEFRVTVANVGRWVGRDGGVAVSSPNARSMEASLEGCRTPAEARSVPPGSLAGMFSPTRGLTALPALTGMWTAAAVVNGEWLVGRDCTLVVRAAAPESGPLTFYLRAATFAPRCNDPCEQDEIRIWPHVVGGDIVVDPLGFPALRWDVPVEHR